MKLSTIAAVALAALVVSAGAAAAMPGNAPAQSQADEHADASAGEDRPDDPDQAGEEYRSEQAQAQGDDPGKASSQDEDARAAASDNAAEKASQAHNEEAGGPPVDLPEQVPDHVVEIHEAILDFLLGSLDGDLGSAVSDLTPDDSQNPADASG